MELASGHLRTPRQEETKVGGGALICLSSFEATSDRPTIGQTRNTLSYSTIAWEHLEGLIGCC